MMRPSRMEKADPDSFGTFLREVRKGRDAATPSDEVARVLEPLVATGSARTEDVLKQSELAPGAFARALVRLREAAYVDSTGEGDEEVLRLTPAGAEFAARNRP
jgi:hypothetical protein